MAFAVNRLVRSRNLLLVDKLVKIMSYNALSYLEMSERFEIDR